MKGALYKTAIWVTKYQSGERSRKLNMGFAKVFFFSRKFTTNILCYMYKQWDPCQSAYRRVVVFSDRQLQRRSQVHSLPKLRSTTRTTKNKYCCILVCPTQLRVFAKVLRKFAKVFAKVGLPYPEVASCVPKYVVLYIQRTDHIVQSLAAASSLSFSRKPPFIRKPYLSPDTQAELVHLNSVNLSSAHVPTFR